MGGDEGAKSTEGRSGGGKVGGDEGSKSTDGRSGGGRVGGRVSVRSLGSRDGEARGVLGDSVEAETGILGGMGEV